MSWSLRIVGTRRAVIDRVKSNIMMPESVRRAIIDCIEQPKDPTKNGVFVDTWGHFGEGDNSIGKLEVTPVDMAVGASEYVACPPASNLPV